MCTYNQSALRWIKAQGTMSHACMSNFGTRPSVIAAYAGIDTSAIAAPERSDEAQEMTMEDYRTFGAYHPRTTWNYSVLALPGQDMHQSYNVFMTPFGVY